MTVKALITMGQASFIEGAPTEIKKIFDRDGWPCLVIGASCESS